MNKLLHRYKIWQFAGNERAEPEKSKPGRPRQIEDLVALMALYDYRPFIETELRGTCSLANGSAANYKTTTISSDSVNLVYDGQAAAKRPDEIRTGSHVHLNLDRIGPVRGVVAAKKAEALQVSVDADCRPELRTKLTYMAAEHAVSLDEGSAKSSAMRIEPAIKSCTFFDHTGTIRKGVIVNLSQFDALVKARVIPPVKSRITFSGRRRQTAEVTRIFEIGFTARFFNVIPSEEFSEALRFSDD